MQKPDWYDNIEEPIRDLVMLLRNCGFNTVCSCGHLPRPYVQMEWYKDEEISQLYDLLAGNGYSRFVLKGIWETHPTSRRFLEVIFNPKMPLADEASLKGGDD